MGLSNTSLNYLNYPTQVRTMQTKKQCFRFCVCVFFLIKMIIFFPQGACIKLIDACLVSRHFSCKYFVTTQHFQVAGEMQY